MFNNENKRMPTPRTGNPVARGNGQRGQVRRATPRKDLARTRRRGPSLVFVVLAALVIVVLGFVVVRSCAPAADAPTELERNPTARERAEFLYRNYYDWNKLSPNTSGRYEYTIDGEVYSNVGIDVSQHQGDIDWQQVASDGINFAIIRAGYRTTDTGVVVKDEMYDVNMRRAKGAGLEVGVYFYSQARDTTEALEEAESVLRTVGGERLDYPIVFDLEPAENNSDRLAGLTNEEFTDIAKTFCDRIVAGGYDAMVYGSRNDYTNYNLSELADFGLWYAEYDRHPSMELRFVMWQYTQDGQVAGIGGSVDMDVDLSPALEAIEAEASASSSQGTGSDAA